MTESVGIRLKELRKSHNFTQKQIANYLGFKQTQIALINSQTNQSNTNCFPIYDRKLSELFSIRKSSLMA